MKDAMRCIRSTVPLLDEALSTGDVFILIPLVRQALQADDVVALTIWAGDIMS